MSLNGSRKPENGPKVDINIVPLVDVALVLLIIIMVTATFINSGGMQVTLPTSSQARTPLHDAQKLAVGITANGDFLWQGKVVAEDDLAVELREAARVHGRSAQVTLQGDTQAPHGSIVRALTLAQQAGFSRLMIGAKRGLNEDAPIQ